jgi:hypothetical protein
MSPRTAASFFLTSAFAASFSANAFADPIEGAFRVSLDTTVFEYLNVSLEQSSPQPGPPGTKSPAGDLSSSQTTFGILGSNVGIGLAGAVTENIMLAGRLSAGKTDTEVLSQQASATAVTLMPSIEFLFGTDDPFRPFVALNGGYRTATSSPGGGTDTTAEAFLIGGGVGMHAFAARSFSIDPGINVFYTTGSVETGSFKFDSSGVQVWVNIGISGWIRPPAASAPPSEGAALPAVAPPPATPPPSHVADDRGRLTTTFRLDALPTDPPGQQLRLVVAGEPRTDGQSASVVVMGLVSTKEDPACAASELAVDGTTTAFSEVHPTSRAGFSASEVTIEMKTDVRALEKLGESRGDATITVCGVKRPIVPAARANVYEWMEQFRSKARAAGTWKDAK